MIRIYIMLGLIGAAGAAYAYHQVTVSGLEADVARIEADNRTLKQNQVQLKTAVATAEASLQAAEENAKKAEMAMSALTARNNELQREKDNAMRIFKDHNLTRLARAKPGLIEKRANNKTAKVFRDLENDTQELMDIDSTTPTDGVQPDAKTGVGAEAAATRTTDSNGN